MSRCPVEQLIASSGDWMQPTAGFVNQISTRIQRRRRRKRFGWAATASLVIIVSIQQSFGVKAWGMLRQALAPASDADQVLVRRATELSGPQGGQVAWALAEIVSRRQGERGIRWEVRAR